MSTLQLALAMIVANRAAAADVPAAAIAGTRARPRAAIALLMTVAVDAAINLQERLAISRAVAVRSSTLDLNVYGLAVLMITTIVPGTVW
jgi:hypothetical protein